jgi:hypothetical protein
MPILFISHATDDDAFVNRLYAPLVAGGITPWVDHRNGIRYGDDWEMRIQEGVNACDAGFELILAAGNQPGVVP